MKLGELGIPHRDPLAHLGLQGERLLPGQVDDPAIGALMLGPWLNLRVTGVVQRGILEMQLKTLEPLIQ
jgi:hypothetical protein